MYLFFPDNTVLVNFATMALAKDDEREAFWESYGGLDRSSKALWRAGIYEARHLAAIRLERYRLQKPEAVRESYASMAAVLVGLSSGGW